MRSRKGKSMCIIHDDRINGSCFVINYFIMVPQNAFLYFSQFWISYSNHQSCMKTLYTSFGIFCVNTCLEQNMRKINAYTNKCLTITKILERLCKKSQLILLQYSRKGFIADTAYNKNVIFFVVHILLNMIEEIII